MKHQLIINNDTAFITSDEEPNQNDLCFYNKLGITTFDGSYGEIWDYSKCKKIIAGIEGLPSIDWNGLEEEFGWVDVEKLANQVYQPEPSSISEYAKDLARPKRKAFIKGFKKAQSLNEKKFSLEDVRKIAQAAFTIKSNNETLIEDFDKWFSNRTKSQHQPKVFDIEVEMEQEFTTGITESGRERKFYGDFKPKITNNSIKILKKL